jgi:hypothetical protein
VFHAAIPSGFITAASLMGSVSKPTEKSGMLIGLQGGALLFRSFVTARRTAAKLYYP